MNIILMIYKYNHFKNLKTLKLNLSERMDIENLADCNQNLTKTAISCKKCNAPSIIYQKYSGMHLCKKHFFEDVERKVKLTIRQAYKINKNETIAVAFSGGKDSSVALYIVHELFKKRPDIRIVALTIDEGISGYRDISIDRAKQFTYKLGIEHIIYSFNEVYGKTMDSIVRDNKIF